jgi:hypothetical protein
MASGHASRPFPVARGRVSIVEPLTSGRDGRAGLGRIGRTLAGFLRILGLLYAFQFLDLFEESLELVIEVSQALVVLRLSAWSSRSSHIAWWPDRAYW